MTSYTEELARVRAFASGAAKGIPNLYRLAVKETGSSREARELLMHDLADLYARSYILQNLPPEAKDQERSEAIKQGLKKHRSNDRKSIIQQANATQSEMLPVLLADGSIAEPDASSLLRNENECLKAEVEVFAGMVGERDVKIAELQALAESKPADIKKLQAENHIHRIEQLEQENSDLRKSLTTAQTENLVLNRHNLNRIHVYLGMAPPVEEVTISRNGSKVTNMTYRQPQESSEEDESEE